MSRIPIRWAWILALVLGFAGGLAYAWLLAPVEYVGAEPHMLRADFKDDFRSAISAAFAANGDLGRARARLELLGDADQAQSLSAQAQRMLAAGETFESIQQVARLAAAVQGQVVAAPPTASALPSIPPAPGETTTTAPESAATLTLEAANQFLQTEAPAAAPQTTPTPRAVATSSPTQGAPYQLVDQQPVCDPGLPEGLLQVVVVDALRQQVPGVEIILTWMDQEEHFFTGFKPEIGNGYADFSMQPGVTYALQLVDGGSPVAGLTAPECEDSDGNPYAGGLQLSFQRP